jgi:hypothetical protein
MAVNNYDNAVILACLGRRASLVRRQTSRPSLQNSYVDRYFVPTGCSMARRETILQAVLATLSQAAQQTDGIEEKAPSLVGVVTNLGDFC